MFLLLRRRVTTCIAIVICCSLCISCQPVLFFVYGVKHPRVEEQQTLAQFSRNLQVDQYRQVICSYNGWPEGAELLFMKGNVFTPEGRLINIPVAANKKACGPDSYLFLLSVDKTKTYPVKDSLQLDTLTKAWLLPNGSAFNYTRPDTVDFVVVIPYAKFMGKKLFKWKVWPCLQAMKDNHKARFDVILLNLDYQKVWGKEKVKDIKFTFSRAR